MSEPLLLVVQQEIWEVSITRTDDGKSSILQLTWLPTAQVPPLSAPVAELSSRRVTRAEATAEMARMAKLVNCILSFGWVLLVE